MKTKRYRFIKETIRTMDWHIHIDIKDGKYTLWKGHIRKDDYEIIEEKEKEITQQEAEKFIKDNEGDLIEVYEFND